MGVNRRGHHWHSKHSVIDGHLQIDDFFELQIVIEGAGRTGTGNCGDIWREQEGDLAAVLA